MYGYIFPKTEIVSEHPPTNCSLGITASAFLKPELLKLSWFVINSGTVIEQTAKNIFRNFDRF